MWRQLVGLVLVGCTATSPTAHTALGPVSELPKVATPVVVPYLPPPVIAPPRFHNECHAFTPSGFITQGRALPVPMKRKVYDFAPMILAPLRRGPRLADRPRIGIGRTSYDLRAMFAHNATEITDCWKAATSRGATPTSLVVGVVIEPLGNTRDLTVESTRAQDDPLVACVRAALATFTFTGTTTQPIQLGATLVFERSTQPEWSHVVGAPVAQPDQDLRIGTVCSPVLDDAPIARVRLPNPLHVTDWDESREPPRRGQVPSVRIGCSISMFETDKRTLRTAIKSNYGALQACYAEAFERDPALKGDVMLRTWFRRSGSAANPMVTGGVGDPSLHACLVAAVQDLWVAPGPSEDLGLEVNLTFTLEPPAIATPADDDPVARYTAGDFEGAIAAWTAKLNTPVSLTLGCTGRAGVLLAIAELEPWLDGGRLRAAIADLARAAAALSPEAARSCVAPVADVIAELTRARGQPMGTQLTYPWLERYEAALPLAPYLDDGPTVRWFYAEALLATPRAAEGLELLQKLAWDPKLGPSIARELEARAERTEAISATCP